MAKYNFIFLLLLCFLNVSLQYEPGITYKYNYETYALLNEDPTSSSQGGFVDKDVGFKVTGSVHLTNVWQNPSHLQERLLRIEMLNVQIHVPTRKEKEEFKHEKSGLNNLDTSLLYAYYNEGRLEKIFSPVGEESSLTNLKKGIASILQFRTQSGEYDEVDVSGHCKVTYAIEENVIIKNKNSCIHPYKGQFQHPHKVQSATVLTSSELKYKLTEKQSVISSAQGKSDLKMFSNIWQRPALLVISNFEFTLQNEDSGSKILQADNIGDVLKLLPEELREDDAVAQPTDQSCKHDCKTLSESLKIYKDSLKPVNLAKVKSASAFLKLLEQFRIAPKNEILKIMKNSKNKNILPQILDLVAAAQTEAALNAAFEVVDFTGHNADLPERFLVSLSVVSHPSHNVLVELLKVAKKKLKSEKIKSTLLLTLGAIANTYCRSGEYNCMSQAVKDVKNYLVRELNKCQTTSCKMMYLNALRNAAMHDTVPTLLKYIKEGGKYTVAALHALKNIDAQYITDEIKSVLYKVFLQLWHREDSTARTLAAEIIISSKPQKELLKNIIEVLSQDTSEVSTFVASKLLEIIENNEDVRLKVKELLKEFNVANYNTFAQKGFSASFRKIMTEATGMNATYGISMETISGGILKRSSFDVNVHTSEDYLRLLSVGLFAGGLSSFAGDSDAEVEEEETTAGMELAVMGNHFRPYVFFTGTGEMMGHVWSGTASEPTLIFQANLLLLDHFQLVPLPNGAVVNVKLKGVLSGDLSGAIQISLWNRNSHSIVKNSGALMVKGTTEIDTAFIKTSASFTYSGEAVIDFVTDLDFYSSPFKMCLQMIQPDFHFRFDVKKEEIIPESNHKYSSSNKRQLFIPAKSYAMHQKNNYQCAKLLTDSY